MKNSQIDISCKNDLYLENVGHEMKMVIDYYVVATG